MDPTKLFVPSYLFDPSPGYYYMYFWPVVILFIVLFIGSFFLPKLYKSKLKHPELLEHIPGRIREFTLLGLLLNFLRDQNIPYLSMRFWLVLFFVLMFVYGIWTYKNYKKSVKLSKTQTLRHDSSDKYLPTPKKKRKKKRK